MSEHKNEEVLELDQEQLQELLGGSAEDKLPPIEIPMEWYDEKEFHKGIHEGSFLAGYITSLLNVGVSEGFVLDLLMNKETINHNLEVARINADMNIEMSKNTKATQEKFEL